MLKGAGNTQTEADLGAELQGGTHRQLHTLSQSTVARVLSCQEFAQRAPLTLASPTSQRAGQHCFAVGVRLSESGRTFEWRTNCAAMSGWHQCQPAWHIVRTLSALLLQVLTWTWMLTPTHLAC